MSRIRFGVAALIVIVTGMGCGGYYGSGTVATTTRTVPAFSSISIDGMMEATVTLGAQQPIEIKGDDNLLPLIQTQVESGVLKVTVANNSPILPKAPLTLKISAPTLTAVNVSGLAKVTAEDVGAQERMDIAASGGSTVTLKNLTTGAVTINASGGSPVTLTGSATSLNATMSGSLSAQDFPVQTATVDLSGFSRGDLTVRDSISGMASGSSVLRVYGNPPNRNIDLHGSASVTYP